MHFWWQNNVAVLECNYRTERRATSEPLGGILKQPCPYLFCKAATTTRRSRSAGSRLALLGGDSFWSSMESHTETFYNKSYLYFQDQMRERLFFHFWGHYKRLVVRRGSGHSVAASC